MKTVTSSIYMTGTERVGGKSTTEQHPCSEDSENWDLHCLASHTASCDCACVQILNVRMERMRAAFCAGYHCITSKHHCTRLRGLKLGMVDFWRVTEEDSQISNLFMYVCVCVCISVCE